MNLSFDKEESNMKKKLLIAAAICASLFVVMPMTNVSAAEVDAEAQGQSAQSDIAVTPCADEIVTKFRMLNGHLQYRRWNQTRGYWVDKKWIDLTELKNLPVQLHRHFFINDSFANYNSSGSSHACACCSYSEARERRSPAEHGSQRSFSASVR